MLLRYGAGALWPRATHAISSHLACIGSAVGVALAKHLLRCSQLVRVVIPMCALMPVRKWLVRRLWRLCVRRGREILLTDRW